VAERKDWEAMIERIGIDLHGVIDSDLEFFKDLLETVYNRTFITIFIISGPPTDQIRTELDKFGLKEGRHYHHVASVVDFLKARQVHMWKDHKDTWWASDEDWWGAKAAICKKLNVDVMIDDKEGYKEYFKKIKTKFVLYTG
jgi:hypothetical protein